jgi:hypothetical protein
MLVIIPPSTRITEPVMYAARSLARKDATSAYPPETAAPAKHQRGLSSKPKIHTKFLVTP